MSYEHRHVMFDANVYLHNSMMLQIMTTYIQLEWNVYIAIAVINIFIFNMLLICLYS